MEAMIKKLECRSRTRIFSFFKIEGWKRKEHIH